MSETMKFEHERVERDEEIEAAAKEYKQRVAELSEKRDDLLTLLALYGDLHDEELGLGEELQRLPKFKHWRRLQMKNADILCQIDNLKLDINELARSIYKLSKETNIVDGIYVSLNRYPTVEFNSTFKFPR